MYQGLEKLLEYHKYYEKKGITIKDILWFINWILNNIEIN